MDESTLPSRLSQIETRWTLLRQAHGPIDDRAHHAQTLLVEGYQRAIYRYLLASLRDADAADELFQEFALRFISGKFHRAEASRGRFRDYLKTVLARLIVDFWRATSRQRRETRPEIDQAEAVKESIGEDHAFDSAWRDEILRRSWKALETFDKQTGRHYFQVLRYRTQHPEHSSAEMAEGLSRQLGAVHVYSSATARKLLQRSRERFATFLVDEVSTSLGTTDRDAVEDELVELQLLPYCRTAVEQHNQDASP